MTRMNEGIIKAKQAKQTRGDHIRNMTDAELAKIVITAAGLEERLGYCKCKPECDEMLDKDIDIPDEMCQECVVEWLKGEAR